MIEAAVFAALDARLDPTSTDPLAVAVSGGGDSMALMRLAAEWARRHGRRLHVLTVDHGLNPESASWSMFVAEGARRLGLPVCLLRWAGPKPTAGLPAAARSARHALLADAAREAGARVLLMGHTADDVLEAGTMRAQGSSVGSPHVWSPSPAWPEGRGLFLLRPLLKVSRAALRLWLAAEGETWIEDPANSDDRFARSRARASRRSDRGAEAAAPPSDAAALRSLDPRIRGDERGLLSGPRAAWDGRALSSALVCASGTDRVPRPASVSLLLDRMRAGEDFTSTLSGARLQAVADQVLIGREPGRGGIRPMRMEPGVAVWDGRFEIETDCAGVIKPLQGRLAGLDAGERDRLRRVPPWQRPTLPVLQASDGTLRTVRKRSLVHERWLAACGAFTREAELTSRDRGATRAEGLSVGGIL